MKYYSLVTACNYTAAVGSQKLSWSCLTSYMPLKTSCSALMSAFPTFLIFGSSCPVGVELEKTFIRVNSRDASVSKSMFANCDSFSCNIQITFNNSLNGGFLSENYFAQLSIHQSINIDK